MHKSFLKALKRFESIALAKIALKSAEMPGNRVSFSPGKYLNGKTRSLYRVTLAL
jgi:hypothetical protein